MKYQNIREEELKNKIAQDYFWLYDCTKIIGNVDFCVCFHQSQPELFEREFLLWAEAKTGSSDIYKSIVQLILTIGKARTFDKFLPPAMLGAFDFEKIAFIHYNDIHEVFYQNDFNWNVTPSDHDSKEFKLLLEKVKKMIDSKALLFTYLRDDRELTSFIKKNFVVGKFGLTKTRIDKNNFMVIYNKWLQIVKPTIAVNWDAAKRNGIIDGDFYLADLLSHENTTLKEKLFVLLHLDHYELDRRIDEAGMFSSKRTDFKDGQVAHTQFWNKYERPPKEEYWDYIVERRDLLVPQDVRERKGSFFTPQIWVELSQKYLTDVLGEDWQDEYTVWDCAAGTGNLLAGLTNKYNIWASTLDRQDVEVMHDRIKNGANLLDDHVFQFDFLNDDFNKLPLPLQAIVNDPEKRKKLVIYINPPYAESGDSKQRIGTGKNKASVASETMIYRLYSPSYGTATRELYTQFLIRIYHDLPESIVGHFSTLKFVQSQNFKKFRIQFKAAFKGGFLVPSDTFDNVKGKFPIGFFIWSLWEKKKIDSFVTDVYSQNLLLTKKTIYTHENERYLIDWLRNYYDKKGSAIGYLRVNGPDLQNNVGVFLTNSPTENDLRKHFVYKITIQNTFEMSVYFSVRHAIESTWLNDRDHFLYPGNGWDTDPDFQNNCFVFSLFHGQNTISSSQNINHWIPFTEQEVNAREKFESNFMSRFILGKLRKEAPEGLFSEQEERTTPLIFSPEATAVLDSGRELWKYYHQQPNCNVNASLYDIREYFQGRNETGKMNSKSGDEQYMSLIGNLRGNLKLLAAKIEPKVYEYGFLRK